MASPAISATSKVTPKAKPPFLYIPTTLAKAVYISPKAKLVYAALAYFSDDGLTSAPTAEEISLAVGFPVEGVINGMKELFYHKMIDIRETEEFYRFTPKEEKAV